MSESSFHSQPAASDLAKFAFDQNLELIRGINAQFSTSTNITFLALVGQHKDRVNERV